MELAAALRARREQTVPTACGARVRAALVAVPRERFVRAEDVADSAEDRPFVLTEDGKSTLSALHVYAAALAALELAEGDAVVDLGAGSGYGACVAAHVVGSRGRVLAVEAVAELAAWADRNARALFPGRIVVHCADAHDVRLWRGATKVTVGFALSELPVEWLGALAPGGRIALPVGPAGGVQMLTLWHKTAAGTVERTPLMRVVYVGDRNPPARPA